MENKHNNIAIPIICKYFNEKVECCINNIENLYMPMGAATFHQKTIEYVKYHHINPEYNKSQNICFKQICFRPYDQSNKDNNRKDVYIQIQAMIIAKTNEEIIYIIKDSIQYLCQQVRKHYNNACSAPNIEIINSEWKSKTLNAGGIGYECLVNKLEVAQITIINKYANMKLNNNSKMVVEFTYGSERLMQSIIKENELCKNLFPNSDADEYKNIIQYYNRIKNTPCHQLITAMNKIINSQYPTYDQFLEANILFNIIDANNIYTEEEKNIVINIIRNIVKKII